MEKETTGKIAMKSNIQDLEGEIWKPIGGYEGFYEVSNKGRIKSLGRKGSGCSGEDRIIRTPNGNNRYCTFAISIKGKRKQLQLHRVVAIAFIPNTENKPEVNHINAVKTDNTVENLEWCSSSENTIHGLGLGIMNTAKGTQKPNARFTEGEVKIIKEKLSRGVKGSDIAKEYGVNKVLIYNIKSGKTWKHV